MKDIRYKRFGAVLSPDLDVKAFGDDVTPGRIAAYVSVFHNEDLGGEIVLPGAFAESITRKMPRGVWGHDWLAPIARTDKAEEHLAGDPRLPESIKGLGGLYIEASFNLDTQRGHDAYSDIKFGSIDEFSIGYRINAAHTLDDDGNPIPFEPFSFGGNRPLYLDALDLVEWSPVLAGMNPLTELVSVKADGVPFGDLLEPMNAYAASVLAEAKAYADRRQKEGRVLSSANVSRLSEWVGQLETVAVSIRELLESAARPERADAAKAERIRELADLIYARHVRARMSVS